MKRMADGLRNKLPEHSEHKNGRYKRDEGGSVASGVHLFKVGEVCCLKYKKKKKNRRRENNESI